VWPEPNSPAAGGASDADKKKAVKCITDAWKKSLHAMQASAVAEHSSVPKLEAAQVDDYNAKNSPKVTSISEMPPAERDAARARVDAGVKKRQKELEDLGAESVGKTAEPPGTPTAAQCLEYQANWLYQNQNADGTFPPMQGNTGAGPGPVTSPKGGAKTAKVKK
jgi:acyl-CoA reductase-like NAD-dependent aldehyde dehydrogenase